MRLILLLLIIGAVYILWDRGAFRNRTEGPGPAQQLGEKLDRGVAKAGEAIERAGSRLQAAAEGSPTPRPTP